MFEQKKRLLLFRLRKEMNGAALDTMRYFGEDYERNYGVQIYALRTIAEQNIKDIRNSNRRDFRF